MYTLFTNVFKGKIHNLPMAKIGESVKNFAVAAFVLLGILFGMMIMTFIFSQLGNSGTDSISDITTTKTNVTPAYINETLYTIPEADDLNYNGQFVVTTAWNYTDDDGTIIPSSDYTVDIVAGTLTNATATVYPDVNLTYTYAQKTDAKLATEATQNNSLNAIVVYTEQSDTQFLTIAIAITLIILIAVFLLFWKIFVANKKKKGADSFQ